MTETFLLDGDAINPLTPEGYFCAGRRDRTKHGGGVLVFLRDSLLYSSYDTSAYHIPETAEMVAVRIEELGLVIITVYAQPSETNTDFIIIALGKLQAKIEADGLKSVICGDFNAHNKDFLGSSSKSNARGERLQEFRENHNMVNMVKKPTRGKNFLDLVLAPSAGKARLLPEG